jgi:hypothetical protein
MDSMKIIKIMVICGLSVDSPWTEKLNLGVSTAKKKFHGIHGTSMESANPCGLHKDYLGE